MLTGDEATIDAAVAEELGIDEYHAQILPREKVEQMEQLDQHKQSGTKAFVGDGINDAPVLARADVGIAGMWAAVFADVGVAMLAVLNAMRVLKK